MSQATHAAFLRGMNVGGRRVTNDDLIEIVRAAGFDKPAAFLASGNLVFDAGRRKASTITSKLERAFESGLGYDVPTIVLTAAEVRAIADSNTLAEEQRKTKAKLQVILPRVQPDAKGRKRALALQGPGDLLAFGEGALFWLPPGSVLDTEMDVPELERVLGGTTTRTKRTFERLAAKFFSD